ncbi:Horcolin [Bienertia sinuspersici]
MQLEKGDRITEVTIRHGAIVDAIGLTVAKKYGNTVYQQFGGNGGAPAKVYTYYICSISFYFDRLCSEDGEYLTRISVENVQKFTSPEQSDGPLVGVFGRNNKYLESVGVLIRKETTPPPPPPPPPT